MRKQNHQKPQQSKVKVATIHSKEDSGNVEKSRNQLIANIAFLAALLTLGYIIF